MQKARKRWREAGLGFFLKDDAMDLQGFLDCLIFADDMVLGADSLGDLFAILSIIVEELAIFGLRVKPGSLELLPVGIILPDREYKVAGLDIKVKDNMSVLGVMIDAGGSDVAAIEHRLAQGWAHFFEREKAFTCKRVPLRLRWKRFSQTVLRTVLHGAGSWAPSLQLADKLRLFEAKCLKIMLNYVDPDAADPAAVREFHVRLNVRLKI
jgi:hypothetical protein